jgi:hypothetical protein
MLSGAPQSRLMMPLRLRRVRHSLRSAFCLVAPVIRNMLRATNGVTRQRRMRWRVYS